MTVKLMTHMLCAYPNLSESQKIFDVLAKKSDYIEIQFPFSDPIADGPVIEQANKIALENGIRTEDCFNFCEKNTGKNVKVLIMTYYNIVLNYGVEKFIKRAKSIGIYGFIIPDLPFDEKDGAEFRKLCEKYDIVFTEIVSPTVKTERLLQIAKLNPKLVYAISQNMTTGSKARFDNDFVQYIEKLKKIFSCPIGVGFGVKTKNDVEKIIKVADFAIIGSEFLKNYNSGGIKKLEKYLNSLF